MDKFLSTGEGLKRFLKSGNRRFLTTLCLTALMTIGGLKQLKANTVNSGAGISRPKEAAGQALDAVQGLIHRLLPGKERNFELVWLDKGAINGLDSFYLGSKGKKVVIKGSSQLALAKALNTYLEQFCHTRISWYAADSIWLPEELPVVNKPVSQTCRFEKRFFLNYCTFGYTTLWWQWKDWERLIDWMALSGINMPLAITGQEYIWQKVWEQFGMTAGQTRAFFTGPEHLPWQRMGNLDRWQGPLPQEYIDGQFELQKRILKRERAFGMTPILPAFAGHVPYDLKKLYPDIKISNLGSYDTGPENDAYFLDPMDSLFISIQKAYLSLQNQLLGTDHYYGADPFNEMTPPSLEPDYLANVSRTIYKGMQDVDTAAVWVQMGWTFYYQRKDWTNPRLEAMIKAVPQGKMLLLDYFCERTEVWKLTDGYFNAPYIWCYLGNFGGNTQMAAPLQKVAKLLPVTEADPNRRHMIGLGSTLEGFGVNEFMYEWLFDYGWNPAVSDAKNWIKDYADSRVGHKDPVLESAWEKLLAIIYNDQVSGVGLGNIVQSQPMLKGHGYYSGLSNYDYNQMATILPVFLMADSVSKKKPGYLRDLAVLEKQVLVNLAVSFRDTIAKAYYAKDSVSFNRYTHLFLGLCDDLDQVTGTQSELLLGKWIQDARAFGTTPDQKNYYEKCARILITTWGGETKNIVEYAAKDWNGLISSYYKKRWQLYFDFLRKTLATGAAPDQQAFDTQRQHFDWNWVNTHAPKQEFMVEPLSNPLEICEKVYRKWALYLN